MKQAILPAIFLSMLANTAYATEKPKQLVLVSFDGAHDNRLWDRSRALGIRSGAHFTYFLSCTFFMSAADKAAYRAPGQKRARSNTGFALSEAEVQARLVHVWQAHLEGHEMANHACGHFDGKDWSKADWLSEFAAFDRTLEHAWRHNGFGALEPEGWADFVKNRIKGFRAPYLSVGKGLLPALKAHGFAYDASLVTLGAERPERDHGLPRFGLPRIPEGPSGRPVIAMDYNLYVRHSGGLNAPSRADEFAERTLAAFTRAFEAEYRGARRPLQIGFHFVEMNGGAYWQALERFVGEVCGKPDVACVSYSEALRMMETPVVATQEADPSAF